MSNPMQKGTNFPVELLPEMLQLVQGKSALATLSGRKPLSFTGNRVFTFTMDSEVAIVGENETKSHGGITVTPKDIIPIKIEYGARVTDEFLYASQEARVEILREFAEGFARKMARGIDIGAMHGLNPRTSTASSVVGTNNFDSQVSATVTYSAAAPTDNLEAALGAVESAGRESTGIAISPAMRTAIASLTNAASGAKLYPEFAFGGQPTNLGTNQLAINGTVSVGGTDHAIVGDFANAFRWGIAKEIPLEIIPYGDPDNSGVDLKSKNQVYLRGEAYVGWAILDPAAFARVVVSG